MNIFKHNLASSKRHGLSVIEVLTSIVVALIGVFGVLAMIPFSVKQTQSGLDQDAATSLARSALSNFEASGYKIVSASTDQLNWVGDDGSGTAVPVTALPTTPLLCIDPLGVTEQGGFGTFPGTFPFRSSSPITMPVVNLLRPDLNQFDVADARRMFRLTDDLVFEQTENPDVTDSDLLGPVQIFNEGPSGFLNRQSTGAVSWCAIAEPIVNSTSAEAVDTFKFYVLVFKDRITDSTVEESAMAAATVTSPTGAGLPLSSVEIDTGLDGTIGRNDWVMLINSSSTTLTNPLGGETNIAFARVSNLYNNDNGTDITTDDTARLTLDGPDFNFTNTTYIVHLRDVAAVFPRTIKLESSSEWTVGN